MLAFQRVFFFSTLNPSHFPGYCCPTTYLCFLNIQAWSLFWTSVLDPVLQLNKTNPVTFQLPCQVCLPQFRFPFLRFIIYSFYTEFWSIQNTPVPLHTSKIPHIFFNTLQTHHFSFESFPDFPYHLQAHTFPTVILFNLSIPVLCHKLPWIVPVHFTFPTAPCSMGRDHGLFISPGHVTGWGTYTVVTVNYWPLIQ